MNPGPVNVQINIDVSPERRRDVSQVVIVEGNTVSSDGIERLRHVHRVPRDDRVGCQVQAEHLGRLVFELRATDLALIGEEQEAPQIVELLALVQLATDGSAIFRIVQATDDVDRLDQAPVLLKRPHQGVLTAIALKLADQERRGDPAHFHRAGHARHVIPASQDKVAIYGAREQRLDVLVVNRAIEAK